MNYLIKSLPIRERPREKLIIYGVENLSDSELLAIILKNGKKNKGVQEIAVELLNKYGSIKNIAQANLEELKGIDGIGMVKALELITCFELGKRIYNSENLKISNAKDVYEFLYSKLSNRLQEEFYGIFLDNKNQIINWQMLFKGTSNQSFIYPRDILREALKSNASSIILAHNHPSGDVNPSTADIELTKELYFIAKMVGLKVMDHIIIGHNKYYSFYDHNWWDSYEKEKVKSDN